MASSSILNLNLRSCLYLCLFLFNLCLSLYLDLFFSTCSSIDLPRRIFYHYAQAGIAQLVECKLPKLDATGSIPVARSIFFDFSQAVREH